MNISTSDCSSGCESGWTMYLDQSSNSADQFNSRNDYRSKRENVGVRNQADDDDEDLSMVSDASSGPRQFNDDEEEEEEEEEENEFFNGSRYFGYASVQRKASKQKKKATKESSKGKQHKISNLDDTASSPVLTISKEDPASLEHVVGFKGKSTLKQHFGFLKSSVTSKPASEKSGGFHGRKWQ